jgi:hypothetical protein
MGAIGVIDCGRVLGLCLVVAIWTYAMPSDAKVIEARSGSSDDLQAAIDQAGTGDTIVIPAGRFPFTGEVRAPDGIHIKGAGRDSTYLIEGDAPGKRHVMISVDARTGKPFMFSGITLQGRLDALQGTNRRTAATPVNDQGLLIKGAVKDVQIYDSRFTKFTRAGIEFVGSAGKVRGEPTGVVYRNEFVDNWYTYLGYGVAIIGSPAGWNRPIELGTANTLFIEDNYFSRNRHCVTGNNGASFVARHNVIEDNYQDAGAFDAHGLTPSWPRGTRSVEIYQNVVRDSIKRFAGAEIRGGSGVIWGNRWSGVSHGVVLTLEMPPRSRPLGEYPAPDQIGNPDGLYIWDNVSSGDNLYLRPTKDPNGIQYWLQENRNYFLSPKPGYKPYPYPHPLRVNSR